MATKKKPDKDQDREPFDPAERIEILVNAASDPAMKRAELAALIVLAKYANGRTGKCYPSYNTIAKSGGMERRSAIRAIQKLADASIVNITPSGQRKPSVFGLVKRLPSDVCVTRDDGGLVTCVSPPSDAQDTKLVTPTSPEPVIEPVIEPVLLKDSGEPATAARERAPSPSADRGKPDGDLYAEFWQAFPVRSTVSEAEEIITELIESGVDLGEIVSGAKRYGEYSRATSGKRRQSAKAWLSREGWRDDWTLPAKKPKAPDPRKVRKAIDAALMIEEQDKRQAALGKIAKEIEGHITRHVWPGGEPEGWSRDDETIREALKSAECPSCAGWSIGESEACELMRELVELCDEANDAIEPDL